MDILNELINSLSEQESKRFRKMVVQKSGSKDRKDLKLFELIRNNRKRDNEEIARTIYRVSAVPLDYETLHAYHQLRQDLVTKLEDFIFQQNQKEDKSLAVMRLLSVSRFLFGKKKYQAGWKYLIKAEELAKETEQFELLNLVYYLQIEYSWTEYAPDIEVLIAKKTKNIELAKKDNDLNTALNTIRIKLIKAHASGERLHIEPIIHDILERFNVDKDINQKPSLTYKLAMLVFWNVLETRDFAALRNFIIPQYEKLESAGLFEKNNPFYKIELLTLVCIAYLKTRDYELCEKHLEMIRAIQKQHQKIPANTLTIILPIDLYICMNRPDKALKTLEDIEAAYGSLLTEDDKVFIHANYTAIYYIQENYSKAIQSIVQLQSFEKNHSKVMLAGIQAICRKQIIECLLHHEIGDREFILHRIRSIERKYHDFFQKPFFNREKTFITLLKQINKNPDIFYDETFRKQADAFIALKEIDVADSEFISFNAWLKSKMDKRPYYDVFLEMTR